MRLPKLFLGTSDYNGFSGTGYPLDTIVNGDN